jgi:hypothetical protein
MNASKQQLEARTVGTQESTVRFLTSNHLIAIIVFVVAIMTANLWTEVVISAVTNLFNVKRDEIGFIKWLIIAFVFTVVAYFIIVYVFRVPITAAFSF